MNSYPHISVLLEETIAAFSGLNLSYFIDGTLGAGGHSEAILKHHPEIEKMIGIDQDLSALEIAKKRLDSWQNKIEFVHSNFSDFDRFLNVFEGKKPQGILVDIGVSSMQLDTPERGFSFNTDGPLDMRMNKEQLLTAETIINEWPEESLAEIFRDYGEEKHWRLAARAVVKERKKARIQTTTQFVSALRPYLERGAKKGLHPLTLVFQGLRIAVNEELSVLRIFLDKAIDSLEKGGRLAVISFHSLEDRIVKNAMRFAASDKWETSGIGGLFRDKEPVVSMITKKPIEASDKEVQNNPRSRSAKLRVVEKR